MDFKKKYNKVEREIQSYNIKRRYPFKIPVICYTIDNYAPKLNRYKFLLDLDMTLINFMYFIRKMIKLDDTISIYLLINNNLCPSSELFTSLYNKYKEDDGFLYITYACESTFG
jgi:GABA(A) receptor-associated protein